MVGAHAVKHWSRQQSSIARSSGEAELYAASKGASEGLGIQRMMTEMGWELDLHLLIDASATKGTISRCGAGKLKHIEVQHWWLQALVPKDRVTVKKIPRNENLADDYTHHWVGVLSERAAVF